MPPSTPPTRRLALFFDGTDNKPKDRTNVWRTHELLADADAVGIEQRRHYIEGVGTDFGEIVTGSAFGTGAGRKIRDGYEWVIENYVEGAEIYVFGFSRGAFTARSLVQMIATCGLTRPEALEGWTIDQAFERYGILNLQRNEDVHPIWRLRHWQQVPADAPPGWRPNEDEATLLDDAKVRVVKIRMAGLWDTVGAIGANAVTNSDAPFGKTGAYNVRITKSEEYGYHALAIDEHRAMFQATLWRTFAEAGKEKETLDRYAPYYEQRWFVGAHSDVGGGYGDDRLPDISLNWMIGKAAALGLAFTQRVEPEAGGWRADEHDSFKAFAGGVLNIWNERSPGDQRFYREIGRQPRPVVTASGVSGALVSINETIDPSVFRRWTDDPRYRPPSLLDYFKRNPAQLPAGTSFAQRTSRIYAINYWNPTGVFLRPEKEARYCARVVPGIGEPLHDASFTARSIAGEDWQSVPHKIADLLHGKRMKSANWFALIGTVDKKNPWVIKDGGIFSLPVGGELMCYFNDVELEIFYENNSGWVVLEIEQLDPLPAPAR
jgi:uncharacterized protein (DUF2235 family)